MKDKPLTIPQKWYFWNMKNKLIIEAGGTNSQILYGHTYIKERFSFRGLNGNMHSSTYIDDYFQELREKYTDVDDLVFYGAGVEGVGGVEIISCIKKHFNLNVNVFSDLLAVCRGMLRDEAGHCFILGTGANACYYDGTSILENRSGHGIILGDEGSGAYLGKLLIQDIMNGIAPKDVNNEFREVFKLSNKDIINKVYHSEGLSAWFGSFSKYISERKDQLYFKNLIEKNFNDFFDKTVSSFDKKVERMFLNGGLIQAFSNEFILLAKTKGIEIGRIVKNSIVLLEAYHFQEKK